MFRKIASLSVALIVAGGVMVAVPAQAATKISNGVACKKSGATTKTSGGTYRCAKNPLVKNAKLTWLSLDCIAAAKDAVAGQKSANESIAKLQAQIPVIDLGIAAETAKKVVRQKKLDDTKLRLTAAQAKLAAAKTEADKRLLTTAVASWTSAVNGYARGIETINSRIKELESAKTIATNKPKELLEFVADSRESAKLVCLKGY